MYSQQPMTASKTTLQLNKNKSTSNSTRSSAKKAIPFASKPSGQEYLQNFLREKNPSDRAASIGQTNFEYYLDRKEQIALPRRATIIPYITLTNESPLLNPELLSQDKMCDAGGRRRRFGLRVGVGGSRGSLPFTPSLNIPEAIPEVVIPRRHSNFDTEDTLSTQVEECVVPTGQAALPFSGSQIPVDRSRAAIARSYSPLRPSDLVVPCSDTFEQVLKNMEREHARQFVTDED